MPALTVTPGAAALSVTFSGQDAAGPLAPASGVVSFRLERSTDGETYSATGAAKPTPVTFDEAVTPGQTRWYRGTVCDALRNCASASSGPIVATAGTPKPPPVVITNTRPVMARVTAARPATCRNCVRVTFTAQGSGPLAWRVGLTSKNAGVKTALRTGTARSEGKVVTLIPLSRVPLCRSRLSLTLSLSSPYGTTHTSRALTVTGACRRG